MRSIKLILLYVLGFCLSIAPILIYFIANSEKYISNGYDGFKLASGGVILACILLLKITGKLKIPSAVSVFSIIFVLSYLLDTILQDVMIFSFLALLGEIFDIIVQIFIKKQRERAENQKIASQTASEISKIFNGRV